MGEDSAQKILGMFQNVRLLQNVISYLFPRNGKGLLTFVKTISRLKQTCTTLHEACNNLSLTPLRFMKQFPIFQHYWRRELRLAPSQENTEAILQATSETDLPQLQNYVLSAFTLTVSQNNIETLLQSDKVRTPLHIPQQEGIEQGQLEGLYKFLILDFSLNNDLCNPPEALFETALSLNFWGIAGLTNCPSPGEHLKYLCLAYTGITDVSHLGSLSLLRLDGTNVTDVSALGGVQTLSLKKTRVTSVSTLGQVKNLDLSDTAVSDVSALGSVCRLNLRGAFRVTDCSALSRLYELDLSFTSVSDVHMLGNVHTLSLRQTNVTNCEQLGRVHTLDLSYTKISNVSALREVHNLTLIGCRKLTDVSPLATVNTLNLTACINVVNADALVDVYSLNLTETGVKTFPQIHNVALLTFIES